MLKKWLWRLVGIKIDQTSKGHKSIQIGHVNGNITIHSDPRDDLRDEYVAVKAIVRQCPWKSISKFMDAHFDTRIIEQLDKHQLYRLRRYAEGTIQNLKKGK
jgi:hypothetical protein